MKWRLPRFIPWESPFPLPRDTARIVLDHGGASDNAGLTMDRLLAYGETRREVALVREFTDRRALVPDYRPLADLIAAYHARWEARARALLAVTFAARPEWRVLIGTSVHQILDVGITLHPVLGTPMAPASALKGVARLYAEAVDGAPAGEIRHFFGTGGDDAEQGDLLFLEGIPTTPPRIERDVMNPHWGMYYGGRQNVPPADYMSPRPVFFLTVGRKSRFAFGVASISKDSAAVEQGVDWLQRGLQELGVGAKTAAGYGYWVIEEDVDPGSAG